MVTTQKSKVDGSTIDIRSRLAVLVQLTHALEEIAEDATPVEIHELLGRRERIIGEVRLLQSEASQTSAAGAKQAMPPPAELQPMLDDFKRTNDAIVHKLTQRKQAVLVQLQTVLQAKSIARYEHEVNL